MINLASEKASGPQTVQASAAQTANNTSQPFALGIQNIAAQSYRGVVAYVIVTAASGTTPSMTVKLQDSIDGTNFADTGAATTAITGVGVYRIAIAAGNLAKGAILQAVATITGTTPSFTYSIVAAGVP